MEAAPASGAGVDPPDAATVLDQDLVGVAADDDVRLAGARVLGAVDEVDERAAQVEVDVLGQGEEVGCLVVVAAHGVHRRDGAEGTDDGEGADVAGVEDDFGAGEGVEGARVEPTVGVGDEADAHQTGFSMTKGVSQGRKMNVVSLEPSPGTRNRMEYGKPEYSTATSTSMGV